MEHLTIEPVPSVMAVPAAMPPLLGGCDRNAHEQIKPPLAQPGALGQPSLSKLFLWLFWGDFCLVLMESIVPSIMPLRLKALGASNSVMGLGLITVPMLITAVLNPVISFKSDRYRSRWGRRIPFILATLPPLVLCLITLGFGDRIGFGIHAHLRGSAATFFSPTATAIGTLCVLVALFSIFNAFVNSVFYYLFNDVVPRTILARFMSWTKMIGMGAGTLYNFVIFGHAERHAPLIFVGVALLYFVGFGLMCLNIREPAYPPPPPNIGGRTGPVAAIGTFVMECHGLKHYWFVFLFTICQALAGSANAFMIFFYRATGLTVPQVGYVLGTVSISTAIVLPLVGWLADRLHPIRVAMIGFGFQVLLAVPAMLIWLVWHPGRSTFWVWIAIAVLLTAPANALMSMCDPPMLMRVFPRDRYGQFCSANAMWRALATIVGGASAGVMLDVMSRLPETATRSAYLFIPFWQLLFYTVALVCLVRLYRSWQKLGGNAYTPPLPANAGRGAPLSTTT